LEDILLPFEEHGTSHYQCVSVGVIDALQRAYFSGRDLTDSVPSFDRVEAAVVVAESLEADRLITLFPEGVFEGSFEPLFGKLSDFPSAVMADVFFSLLDVGEEMEHETTRDVWAMAWALLEKTLDSPVASPMLWYEDIFNDVARQAAKAGDFQAVKLLKRSLAHDLRFHDGVNVDGLLRDLADAYLQVGDPDSALEILTGLLRDDPGDVWTYNMAAISFDDFGLTAIGAEATRRGLALVDATGDPHQLRGQLTECLDRLQQSDGGGAETQVDPDVLADFRAALKLEVESGKHRPAAGLARWLVPDIDRVPVKRPPKKPDLPPPEMMMQRLGMSVDTRTGPPPNLDLGRNDPCWCGSGKKYKHCHLRSDQAKSR
jgi:tetratricopeptide (TPR) repeat protein